MGRIEEESKQEEHEGPQQALMRSETSMVCVCYVALGSILRL